MGATTGVNPGKRDYGAELREQIATWGEKLDVAMAKATANGLEGQRFLENVRAYQKDARHFESIHDLVRSFECLLWAWAWLEIGERVSLVRRA